MPIRDPARAILVLLELRGPMTADDLEERVPGGVALAKAMARAGQIVWGEDGSWKLAS